MQLTSHNFSGLINRRFLKNFTPIPALCRFPLGEKLPDFTLLGADDNTYQLSNYRGKPVVLAFTRIFTEKQYCPFCYPHILALIEAHPQFVGLGGHVADGHEYLYEPKQGRTARFSAADAAVGRSCLPKLSSLWCGASFRRTPARPVCNRCRRTITFSASIFICTSQRYPSKTSVGGA